MSFKRRFFSVMLAGVAMASPLMLGGCAEHATVRVYDPYYSDYHVWDNGEVVYYRQWINETHRPYVEYKRLPEKDQHAYWDWRHSHR
jgi:hypothetical protein